MSQPDDARAAAPGVLPERFPVAVLWERTALQDDRWRDARWEAIGIVAGDALEASGQREAPAQSPEPEPVFVAEGVSRFLVPGHHLTLYRDECESYYANLTGERPSAFVVCSDEGEERPAIEAVTLSYDAAAAGLEADALVFAVPMPPEVYRWLEHYVVTHYAPEVKRKRKRVDWREGTGDV